MIQPPLGALQISDGETVKCKVATMIMYNATGQDPTGSASVAAARAGLEPSNSIYPKWARYVGKIPKAYGEQ